MTLAPALQRTDLRIVLFKDRIEHEVPANGPPIIALSSGEKSLARAGLPILSRAVRAARGFDILVSGLEWAPTFITTACGALARRPVVATIHVNLDRYQEFEPVPASWPTLMRRALRSCAAVVAVSEDVRASVLSLGIEEQRVHVIPNPVPRWERTQTEEIEKKKRFQIVTVSSLKRIKGVELALEAAAKLADLEFEWRIVGDGPERDRLRRRASELGVDHTVQFVGFQSNPWPFYASADLYVLPSYTEGFGLSLVEAMGAGLPAVATRCGSVIEKLVAGAGELVPNGDAEALAAAIRALAGDPARRKSLGEAALHRARNYEPSIVAEQYEQLFEEVCGQPR